MKNLKPQNGKFNSRYSAAVAKSKDNSAELDGKVKKVSEPVSQPTNLVSSNNKAAEPASNMDSNSEEYTHRNEVFQCVEAAD